MKSGFTLIELLVVVLIIGILAAIALPMYTKTVERSRMGEMVLTVKAIMGARERWRLEHGEFTGNETYEDLDMQLPGECFISGGGPTGTSICVTKHFSYYNLVDNGALEVRRCGTFDEDGYSCVSGAMYYEAQFDEGADMVSAPSAEGEGGTRPVREPLYLNNCDPWYDHERIAFDICERLYNM